MEWRKFASCVVMILIFACAALFIAACSSSTANVITVTVNPPSRVVIAGQVATFTATVGGSTTTTVTDWPCTYSYTPLPTSTTPNPKAVTGSCTSGTTVSGITGSIGTWVITTTNGSNVLTYTAPTLANFPNPAPTLTFTATADADKKKTNTAVISLDSGIRISVTPSTVTVPVGITPAATVSFQASLLNSPALNLQWLVTQPNTASTVTANQTYNPASATCSPTCGSIDVNGIFSAPATLPTDTTPAGSKSTSPTTVYVVVWSNTDSSQYAVAQITLVSATNNSINFTGIFPPTVAAGSVSQNIYLNAKNLLNTTNIYFIPPGATKGLPIALSNTYTIPISKAYCTASATGVTPVVTCDASLMTRIELTQDQLSIAGTAHIEIDGIPGSQTATQPCTNIPNSDGSTATSNISCPLTVAYTGPALVSATPDNFPQGSNASIAVDGGYFGGTNTPIVKLLLDGALDTVSSSGPRQFVGTQQGTSLQNPGLYEVTIQSNAPQGAQPLFPSVTTNVAVQPVFANFIPNPSNVLCTGAPVPQSAYPPCILLGANNPAPSSFALDSANGFAVLTEQGSNTIQVIDLTGSAPVLGPSFVMTTGSGPTSVALDTQLSIPGHSGQDLGVVVSSGDSKLYLYAISRTAIAQIGSIPVDLQSLILASGTGVPTPYSVGVDPETHLAALAYSSSNLSANIGFIVDVNPNLDGSDPHTCFANSTVQTPPCALAPVSLVTGATPQVVMQPGAPLAYVTPGGQGSTSVVDLLQQGVSAKIAPAASGTTSGAVRTNGIVTIITLTPHGINPALGGTVIISGLLPADLNGTYQVIPGSILDPYTFQYSQPGSPTGTEVETNTSSNEGTVQYGTPYYSFNTTSTATGAAINPTTRMFAFADYNANFGQIGFISTSDQTVTSLTMTAGSCKTCTPNPSGAPEIGFRWVSFDPFTDVLVAYDPSTNAAGPSFPGNAISLINPGTTTAGGGYSAPYRIIAAIPTGQVGSGTYTPAGQSTALTVNGPMIYDPKSKFVLVGNAGSNTLSYLSLDPSGQFKKLHVDSLQVMSASAAVPSAQPTLGSPAIKSCDPTSATNPCMPQAVQLGQTATLRILGQGFLSGTGAPVVRLDGNSTGVTVLSGATDSEVDVTVDASVLTVAHDYALDVQVLVAGSPVVSNALDLHAVGVLDMTPVCTPTATFPQGPEAVAIDDSLHVAFVTNYACNSVSVININPNPYPNGFIKEDGTQAPYGALLTTVKVGNNPVGVGVIPRLGYAVVANNGDTPTGTASIIDYNNKYTADTAQVLSFTTTSGTSSTTSSTVAVGLAPLGVAVDQDRALALVANSGSNTLSSIDLTVLLPGAVTTTVPVATTVALSGPPTAVAVDPDGALAVVTNLQNSGTTSAAAGLDVVTLSSVPPTRSTTASVSSLTASLTGLVFDPSPAFNPTPSDRVFYAASTQQNAIYSFDPTSGSTLTYKVGINPYSLGFNYQTGTLLTINSTSNTSSIVDSQYLKTTQTLGISSQSQFAVAVDNWFNTAVIVDQNNNRVLLLALPK